MPNYCASGVLLVRPVCPAADEPGNDNTELSTVIGISGYMSLDVTVGYVRKLRKENNAVLQGDYTVFNTGNAKEPPAKMFLYFSPLNNVLYPVDGSNVISAKYNCRSDHDSI